MSKSRIIMIFALVAYMVGLYTFGAIFFRKDIKEWIQRKFRKGG